ncbi:MULTISPECIES: hypothetical protein [Duncaniella]|nr:MULTISPECIES: hypothetical protein [Duncaniella]
MNVNSTSRFIKVASRHRPQAISEEQSSNLNSALSAPIEGF